MNIQEYPDSVTGKSAWPTTGTSPQSRGMSSDSLTFTINEIDRLIAENHWKRPTELHLTPAAAKALVDFYSNPRDDLAVAGLVGRSYAGVPIVTVDASEIRLGFPKSAVSDDDLDAAPMTRTCSLNEDGVCESCQ